MNDRDLGQSLGEWMGDSRSSASPWVLDSVIEHARLHTNQRWWRRALDRPMLALAVGQPARAQPRWGRVLAASVTGVLAVVVTAVLFVPGFVPEPERDPALMPAATARATPAPSLSTRPPADEVGFPADGGLVGSVWLRRGDDERDSYVTLHPDGTIVQVGRVGRRPVGIGAWQPTGERSLTSLVAWPDADPVNHIRPGYSTYREEWIIDEDGSAATLDWTADMQSADGSSATDVTGASTLVRLQRLPLPPEAAYPSPAEPDWELALGPMVQGSGSGIVTAVREECLEPGDPPEYLVIHGDGTAFLAGYVRDNGPGLWVPTGPETRALSSWFGLNPAHQMDNWPVAQLVGTGSITVSEGTSREFNDHGSAETLGIEPMDEPLPTVDPALWPDSGSVWLQDTDSGTAITAYLSDGTTIVRDPRYGTGAGYWQPLDADTIAAWVAFSTLDAHVQLWSEATTGSDGETLSLDYKHQDKSGGPVETGHATATRLRIEP